jgi:hypothetical protein
MSFFDDYDDEGQNPITVQGQGGPPTSIPIQNGMQDQGLLPLPNSVTNQLDPNTPGSAPFVPSLDNLIPPPQQKQSILSKVHDALTGGNTPAGYDALLTPQEMQQARPSLLQAIFRGNRPGPTQQYQQNLDHIIQMHQIAMGVNTAQRYQKVNQYIAQKYPSLDPMSSSQDQRNAQLQSMYADMVRLGGDPDMIGKMGEVVKQTASVPKQPARELKYVDLGDHLEVRDPVSGALYGKLPKGLSADQQAEFGERLAQAKAIADSVENDSQNRMAEGQANRFQTTNAQLMGSATKYANVKNAITQLRAGNSAAFEPAFINYAGAVDQGAQLRGNVIKMIQDVDPSVKGRWNIAMQRMASGTLPTKVIDQMEQMVDTAHKQNADYYEQRRAGAVKQNPRMENMIPLTADIFNLPNSASKPAIDDAIGGANKVRGRLNK